MIREPGIVSGDQSVRVCPSGTRGLCRVEPPPGLRPGSRVTGQCPTSVSSRSGFWLQGQSETLAQTQSSRADSSPTTIYLRLVGPLRKGSSNLGILLTVIHASVVPEPESGFTSGLPLGKRFLPRSPRVVIGAVSPPASPHATGGLAPRSSGCESKKCVTSVGSAPRGRSQASSSSVPPEG